MKAFRLIITQCVIILSNSLIHAQSVDWLTELPDNVCVRELSIPGSHDAATGNGFTSGSSFLALFSGVTQSLSISAQWDAGIRAFDLRPSYNEDADGRLKLYHGILETNVTLKSALQILIDKLKTSPKEMSIVLLRHESESDNNSDLWSPAVSALLDEYDDYVVTFNPDLTLGQARGKILILSRDNFTSSKAGMISGWNHSENFSDQKKASISIARNRAVLYVQDFYECQTVERKLKAVETMLDYSTTYSSSNTWIINHTSGYIGITGTNSNVLNLAKDVNSEVMDYLTTSEAGRTGIMLLDFAGVDMKDNIQVNGKLLADMIISQNGRYVKDESSCIKPLTPYSYPADEDCIYDLHGRFLGKGDDTLKKLPKGFYIVNHKIIAVE